MRTIKFKGKTKSDNQWVYGFYFKIDENHYILENVLGGSQKQEIIPKTLGQFTGFFDKNGKEIYEGDLLGKSCEKPLQVYFNDGQFQIKEIGSITLVDLTLGKYVLSNYKVIGNIYENPKFYNNEKSKYTPI